MEVTKAGAVQTLSSSSIIQFDAVVFYIVTLHGCFVVRYNISKTGKYRNGGKGEGKK